MRIRLPLSLALATLAAGCRAAPDGTEQAAFQVPQRDLTLQQAAAPQLEVASPVELARTVAHPARSQRPRRARRPEPVPVPAAAHAGAEPVSSPAPAVPAAAAAAANDAADANDPYALPPGKTVTAIPASSSPSNEPGWTDRGPPDARRGTTIYTGGGGRGGDCGGRHPGGGQRPDGFR